jgi:hypothetical protein
VLAARPVGTERAATFERPAGFYRVRSIGPERAGEGQFVVLEPGPPLRVNPPKPATASPRAIELVEAAGGRYDEDKRLVTLEQEGEQLEWVTPATLLTVDLGNILSRRGDPRLIRSPLGKIGAGETGVAFYGVEAGASVKGIRARVWPAGEGAPRSSKALAVTEAGVVSFTKKTDPGPHWLAIQQGAAQTVFALPVLPGRVATVVAQFGERRPRVYQFHPTTAAGASSTPERLRRVEHLQRLLLGGRIDGAVELAEELAAAAPEDPFAGVLAGYAMLRIGIFDQRDLDRLQELADAILAVAPGWSDPYILRGEAAALGDEPDIAARDQAFTQAINTGIPIFGEGLTRQIEGLRASGFSHPRGALVRHIFQRHFRGLMWAAFTPLRPLERGKLVISGADLGYEG